MGIGVFATITSTVLPGGRSSLRPSNIAPGDDFRSASHRYGVPIGAFVSYISTTVYEDIQESK